jgi:hypothetical protein
VAELLQGATGEVRQDIEIHRVFCEAKKFAINLHIVAVGAGRWGERIDFGAGRGLRNIIGITGFDAGP